jgi:uncharacterized glyoxalase superfamily protein PhnB
VNPTAEASQVVTPYIMTQDIEPLIAFVKRVFDAEEAHRSIGSAGGVHCELRIGNSVLMLGGATPEEPVQPRLIALHVYVDDVDAVYRRAIAGGATSMGEPSQMPYNERAGYVSDPAGNHWYIATHTGPTYFSREPRTVTPSLHVRGSARPGPGEFIKFLETAFDAAVDSRHEQDGRLRHAVLRIGEDFVELGTGDDWTLPAPAALVLDVTDCDAVYRQALTAGATSIFAPAEQSFGRRMGGVKDPWSNEWYVASP